VKTQEYPKTQILKHEGNCVRAVWTADGALKFSEDVSDHPETPGSPNMG